MNNNLFSPPGEFTCYIPTFAEQWQGFLFGITVTPINLVIVFFVVVPTKTN